MKFYSLLLVLIFSVTMIAEAQLRSDLNPQYEDFGGTITHTHGSSSSIGDWMNMLNMTMSHSYSMTFSNFGGQTQNINAYTNSMFFDVSDRMNAQVDISLLHSPFGNNFMNNDNLGTRVIIDQARLDYQISSNANISIQFSQRPYYGGFGNYGFGSHHSPFQPRSAWY